MIPYKDLNRRKHFPWMTALLLASNIGLFIYLLTLPESLHRQILDTYSVIPYEFKTGHNLPNSPDLHPFFTVFTAMFLHGGWLHLIGNMCYLWIFGDNVEDRMGPFHFLAFYLLCGVIATFAQIYSMYDSKIPILGASGAIAGVLAAYLRLFPKSKIGVLVPILFFLRSFILPAWLVLGFWVVLQVLEAHTTPAKSSLGGVAYFAHLGGFVFGLLLMPLFIKKVVVKQNGKRK